MKQMAPDADWYQTVVTDINRLSGSSVVEFVRPIIQRLGARVVVASDLEGAIGELKESEGMLLSCDDFLKKAADAAQYDWAFFFLYTRAPTPEETDVSDIRTAMANANVTIRLADDEYFYVYAPDREIMYELKRRYPKAEFKVAKLAALDIPY